MIDAGAATPGYYDLTDRTLNEESTITAMTSSLKFPVLVKPSPSSGSRGITDKCVCNNGADAWKVGLELREEFGGAYVEEFICGRFHTILDRFESMRY